MSKHKDPKTVMRYDHGRENLEKNTVDFMHYEDEGWWERTRRTPFVPD